MAAGDGKLNNADDFPTPTAPPDVCDDVLATIAVERLAIAVDRASATTSSDATPSTADARPINAASRDGSTSSSRDDRDDDGGSAAPPTPVEEQGGVYGDGDGSSVSASAGGAIDRGSGDARPSAGVVERRGGSSPPPSSSVSAVGTDVGGGGEGDAFPADDEDDDDDSPGDGGDRGRSPDVVAAEEIQIFRSLSGEQRRALFASLVGDGRCSVENDRGNDDDDDDNERRTIETAVPQNPEALTDERLPLTLLDEATRLELFRRVVDHEDNLLHSRVNWIMMAQEVLMGGFITSEGPRSMRYIVAAVGFLTVLVTVPALSAAGRNIEIQRGIYFLGMDSDARCVALHGHARDSFRVEDSREMQRRGERGHVFPTMSFRRSGGVQVFILHTVMMLVAAQLLGWVFLLIALVYDWSPIRDSDGVV